MLPGAFVGVSYVGISSMVSFSSSRNGPRRSGRPSGSRGATVGRRGGSAGGAAPAVLPDRSASSCHSRPSSQVGHLGRGSTSPRVGRSGRGSISSHVCFVRSPASVDLAAQSGGDVSAGRRREEIRLGKRPGIVSTALSRSPILHRSCAFCPFSRTTIKPCGERNRRRRAGEVDLDGVLLLAGKTVPWGAPPVSPQARSLSTPAPVPRAFGVIGASPPLPMPLGMWDTLCPSPCTSGRRPVLSAFLLRSFMCSIRRGGGTVWLWKLAIKSCCTVLLRCNTKI